MANSNINSTSLAYSSTATTTTPKAIASTTQFDFDAITINADAVQASVYVSVDNQGTPASGDYVDVFIKYSSDGTTYDTNKNATFLGRLDTYSVNPLGEDPAVRTFTLNVSGKQKFKISVLSAQATRTMNIVGVYNEHRMA